MRIRKTIHISIQLLFIISRKLETNFSVVKERLSTCCYLNSLRCCAGLKNMIIVYKQGKGIQRKAWNTEIQICSGKGMQKYILFKKFLTEV